MKRHVTALLALCLLLAGCGEAAELPHTDTVKTENTEAVSSETKTEEIAEGIIPDSLPEDNFGGETMKIMTTSWYEAKKYIFADEPTGDIVNDALFDSRMNVENRFNVKLEVDDSLAFGDVSTVVHNMVMAGDASTDVVYNQDCASIRTAMQHDFLDLYTLERLDFSKPWWNSTLDIFSVNGVMPVTANCFSLSGVFMGLFMFINKDMAAANDIEIPYDDVRAGTWYVDDLIEMTKNLRKDLNGDGKFDKNDQYGFLSNRYYGGMAIQSSLGAGLIEKDSDGFLSLRDDLEPIVHIMNKAYALFDLGYAEKDMAVADYAISQFLQGQGLIMYAEGRVVYEKGRDAKFSYGVLPCPKLDESQKDYAGAGFDIYWGVVRTAIDHAKMIGTVMEALSCNNYNYGLPAVWEQVLGAKLSDAPDDAEMFGIIRDTQYVDLCYAFGQQDTVLAGFPFLLAKTKEEKLVSYVEKNRAKAESAIEKINADYPAIDG